MIILHAYRIVCLLCLITPHRDPKPFGIQLLPKIFPFTYKYFFCVKWLLYVKFFFSRAVKQDRFLHEVLFWSSIDI